VQASTQSEVATEFYKLYCEKQIWSPKEKRLDELTEIIRGWYPDLAGDQTAIAFGDGCEVQIGQKPVEKTWTSMHAVYKAAGGLKPFLKLCSVTFKALSAAIGNAKAEALQSEAQTGKRRLVAVATQPAAVELPKAA
jgi:hypothetical protein